MEKKTSSNGFTLVELLVVIGIIAILIALLLPSLAGARRSAKAARCASDVHQMLIAYQMYYQQNRGCLMYGYPPATVNGVTITVDVPGVGSVGYPVASRYPWRLIAYFDGIWPVLHAYEEVPTDYYTLSVAPAIGLNAVFLGGHKDYDGYAPGDKPYKGPNSHVAFCAAEIRRPSEQIVFAETQVNEMAVTDDKKGLNVVNAPRSFEQLWHIDNGKFVIDKPDVILGLPKGRYGDRAIVGFFDGHAVGMLPKELDDMRLWAKNAKAADYMYPDVP